MQFCPTALGFFIIIFACTAIWRGRSGLRQRLCDLEVNVKAEREIEVILRHLEYKNFMLNAMLENRGVTVADDQDRSNL